MQLFSQLRKLITNPGVKETCNSKFGCKSYELFYFSRVKFIFRVIFEELLDVTRCNHVSRIAQGLQGRIPKKFKKIAHKILDFYFFLIIKITHNSTWYNLQCDHLDLILKPLIFLKKICKFHSVEVWDVDSSSLK